MKFSLIYLILLAILINCKGKGGGGGSQSDIQPTTGPDTLSPYLWHLDDIQGSYINNKVPLAGKNINLESVHSSYTGEGVMVVISDSRIDLTHPELKDNANTALSKDYRKSSPYFGTPSSSDNTDGHGTAVSGLSLSKKENGQGGYGVAPDATLIGYNYVVSDQSLSKTLDQASLNGFEGIFNFSYGYSNCMIHSGEETDYASHLRNSAISNNHIYVTAAGNDFVDSQDQCGGDEYTPFLGNANYDQVKTFPYLIVVGATNAQGTSADYSTPGSNVWISAPGGDQDIGIMVADPVGCNKGFSYDSTFSFDKTDSSLNPTCSYYSSAMGTSFASPIVTGAIALLKNVNPSLSWRDIKHILAATATKIHPSATSSSHPLGSHLAGHTYQQGWITNGASYPFHPWYGFGQINVAEAVALALNPDFDLYELKTTEKMDGGHLYSSGTVNLSIPDYSSTGVTSTIDVSGHNLFIEHVMVVVNINHTFSSNLGIELTSPSGTTTKLMNINSSMIGSNLINAHFGANGFYGERSDGNWTIKVVDGKGDDVGTLQAWSLTIIGNRGALLVDSTPPAPVTNFLRSGGNLTWTASVSSDVARYEVCITPSSTTDGCDDGDWRPVLQDLTTIALSKYVYKGQIASFVSGVSYSSKIRAIDTSENESTFQTLSWTQP
jgi:subtilisin-like proprotein convertase family protein